MSRASDLYRLQEIDLESDRLNGRLEEIARTLEDSSELEALKAEMAKRQSSMEAAQSGARKAQHEVEDQRLKIEKTDSALYGGSVQNPKELEDLQMESESLKRHLETLEDRYLEAMLTQDEAVDQFDQMQAEVDTFESALLEQHGDLSTERARIQEQLPDLVAQREAVVPAIPEDDLRSYERLRSKNRGVAVASLNGQSCSVCGLTLSASDQQAVRTSDDPVHCDQCGRILYGG